jgi:hypothetical protein
MRLEINGLSPLSVVDCLNKWRCGNLATTEVTAIQTLHRVASSLHGLELDEDLSRIGIGVDVHDAAKLPIAFGLDISKQIILPVSTTLLLPVR